MHLSHSCWVTPRRAGTSTLATAAWCPQMGSAPGLCLTPPQPHRADHRPNHPPASLQVMEVLRTHGGRHPGVRWVPVTRGAHRSTDAGDTFRATALAWQAVLPPEACFTHVTGARLLGLWLPPLPSRPTTVVQLPASSAPVRRPGLRASRTAEITSPVEVAGLRVAPVGEILLSLCRDLGDLDALMAVDASLHLRLTSTQELHEVAAARRRGAPRLRRLLQLADGRSESPWETVLRVFHRAVGAPVTPQVEVFDGDGAFIARGDLRLDGTRVLHEYDGDRHLEVARQRHDLRRARRLEAAGWVRRGYTASDLLHRPHEVLGDIDRSLGRTHDLDRLVAWAALVHASTLTRSGRARVWPLLTR